MSPLDEGRRGGEVHSELEGERGGGSVVRGMFEGERPTEYIVVSRVKVGRVTVPVTGVCLARLGPFCMMITFLQSRARASMAEQGGDREIHVQ